MRKIYILGFSGISNKMLLALILLTFVSACNDDDFVKEEPLDFLTPSNAYTTPGGIDSGIIGMYSDLRAKWLMRANQAYTLHGNGTDVGYDGETPGGQRFLTNYLTSVTPQSSEIEGWWNSVYAQIQSANVLIKAINEMDDSLWTNGAEKNSALAEAMFFRAWSYRF